MDAEIDASGKLLQEKSNGVYAPTTEQKASVFITFSNKKQSVIAIITIHTFFCVRFVCASVQRVINCRNKIQIISFFEA